MSYQPTFLAPGDYGIEREADGLRALLAQAEEALEHLMGGKDWPTEYECCHGIPLGKKCRKGCPSNLVRNTMAALAAVREGAR